MRSVRVGLLVLVLSLCAAPLAHAEFSPATLVSGNELVPFEQAANPALSGDDRYVVFQGTLAGEPGVYRRDLQSGEMQLVAGVRLARAGSEEVNPIPAPDASAPSISADGRYIAFTSAAVLGDPAEDAGSHGCPQVYVRDMDQPIEAPGAYTLASALDHQSTSLTYAASCGQETSGQLALAGAQAAPGVALSADGSQVVFTVLSASDLAGAGSAQLDTPASQVAVRDLADETTTLVSATPGPEGGATPGGGAFPSTESELHRPGPLEAMSSQPSGSTAAISADGTTVAWLGTNVLAQVPSATDIAPGMASLGSAATEVEPLWRRVADGARAETRRLLSNAGLDFYFVGSHEETEAANGGSLYPGHQEFAPLALSRDGTVVATIANSPTEVNEASYRFLGFNAPPPAEAYVIHVGDGATVAPQVTALTATPNFTVPNAIFGGVSDIAISADGSRVVFGTRRSSFALSTPTFISPPAPEVASEYTYEVNLQRGTLQRVTSTYDGSPPDGNPGRLSFSEDGLSLAFASSASDLFYGNATGNASQVYILDETPTPSQVAPQSLSAPPATPLPVPRWVLSATASAEADGSVLVEAEVPGAGKLGVSARTQLPAPVSSKPHSRAWTTVAQGTVAARSATELHLRLRVAARYRALVGGKHGLYSLLRVSFTATGHAALAQQIPMTLHARKPLRTPRRSSKRSRSKGRRK